MIDIQPYLDAARPHYAGKDPGHDYQHILRMAGRLEELSQGLDPMPAANRLSFLCAFHGLGGRIKNDPEFKNHISAFLTGLRWQDAEIRAAYDLLETHISHPQTPEQKIVHDANFFEVTGAFGIAKAFTVGGARGQSYEETLAIFESNIDQLDFKTPIGRTVYQERIAETRQFIETLRLELKVSTKPAGKS